MQHQIHRYKLTTFTFVCFNLVSTEPYVCSVDMLYTRIIIYRQSVHNVWFTHT